MKRTRTARVFLWRPASAAAVALCLLALIASCTTTPYRGDRRAAAPLERCVTERFEIPDVEALRADATHAELGCTVHEGTLRIAGDELSYRYCVPTNAQAPAPFLLVLPILAGGQWITAQVCTSLAQRGIAAGTIERRWRIFKESETIDQLEEKFVRAVRQQRGFLAWMGAREGIDASRVGCFGMSVGGMLATMLAAVEPRIDCAVICLAGGDFARLAIEADEIQVARWVAKRCAADSIDACELQSQIHAQFSADPLDFAPSIDPSRVLFVNARFDGVIPKKSREALWEALGEPARIDLPLGHYSTIVALEFVVARAARFAVASFERTDPPVVAVR